MSAAAPKVLLYHPMLARFETPLAAEGWAVAKAWELSDSDRAEVRAMAHAGDIPLPKDFLEGLPNLGLIACVGAGYDGVDVAWCRARGIEVTNAAGLNADDVADHAIGLMIAGWRGPSRATARSAKGNGVRVTATPRAPASPAGGSASSAWARSARRARAGPGPLVWRSPGGGQG